VSAAAVETLDCRDADPAVVRATLADIAVSNTLFGGRQAATWGVRRLLAGRAAGPITLLDVGAGMGDIARHLVARLAPRWALRPVALDHLRPAARLCQAADLPALVADLAHLPLRPGAVDVVLVSQVLHHLARNQVPAFLRCLNGLAGMGVVVADLRRARLAQAGIWAAGHILPFHPVTRRDGMLSVGRGFHRRELAALCAAAGVRPTVARRPGWRLVAWWAKER